MPIPTATSILAFVGENFALMPQAPGDFEQGKTREYILGLKPPPDFLDPPLAPDNQPVQNPNKNDPRQGFVLHDDDLNNGPTFSGLSWTRLAAHPVGIN